jgi:hypothetical protein
MRRTVRFAAVSLGLAALSVPATADADVLDAYQRLANRGMTPAPLVPTAVPPALAPIDRTVGFGGARGGGYSLRLAHEGRNAVLVVAGGELRSMRALRRDRRRLGYADQRRTRVRGRRGYLLTRRLGPVARELAWVERGVVYTVGSGTPRKVSLRQLRSTARKLERLEPGWIGGSSDPENFSEASAVSTERTVTADVSFQATCAPPGSPDAAIARVGQAEVTLLPRDGDRFTFDIAEHRAGSQPWAGTVTGTISPAGITLEVHATGTIDGDACDSGPLTLVLDRRAR